MIRPAEGSPKGRRRTARNDPNPIECLSRDEMNSRQLVYLRSTVAYVYKMMPFYKSLFDETGISPGGFKSLQDLAALPFTQKKDLVNNYPWGMCAVNPKQVIRLHASSGTTGKPINTYYTRRDQENWSLCTGRNARTAGITADDICQIAFKYTLFTGAFGHHLGAEQAGAMVIPTSAGQTERQIMMIRDMGVTVIHCTPSYALVLLEKFKEMGIGPGDTALRLGIHGAESMSEEMRSQVEKGLGITTVRDYGLTELGGPGVSIECPHQTGFHINEDFFYPEVVNPITLQPLPLGEVGELVFTTLQKEATPLIRYRTRDITHLIEGTCDCGRTLIRHGPILGRSDDMLIVGGVNFYPSQLESVILSFTEMAPHYNIFLRKQGPLDSVTTRVEAEPEFWAQAGDQTKKDLARAIQAKVKDLLGFRIEIELAAPGLIPRSEGKTKRVFDER